MKKIDHTQFRVGGIYNAVYVGDNKAYARVNGKSTFLVLETAPELKTVTLFSQFGTPTMDDVRADGPTTYTNPSYAFREYELFEPENAGEWFKKSVKVATLEDAVKIGVTLKEIKRDADWRGRCPFVAHLGSGPGHDLQMVSTNYNVEGRIKDQPYLQTVIVAWKNWEVLKADFAEHNIAVRT